MNSNPRYVCGHPDCPLGFPHHQGVFLHGNRHPPPDSHAFSFGLSNPPPRIWIARDHMDQGFATQWEVNSVVGFIAAHGIRHVEPGPPGLTIWEVAMEVNREYDEQARREAEREEQARRETAEREEQARREAAERVEQERRETAERYEQALRRLRDIGINEPNEEQREWPHEEIVAMLIYETACLETEDIDMAGMNLDREAAAATTTADQQGASGQAPPAAEEDPVAPEDPAAGETSAAGESSAAGEEPAAGEDVDMEDV